MTIQAILYGKSKRSLFDSGSHEFNRGPLEEKIQILKELNRHNLLDQTIREYQAYYHEERNRYIIYGLKPTLKRILSYLRHQDCFAFITFEKLSLQETVEELKKELAQNP